MASNKPERNERKEDIYRQLFGNQHVKLKDEKVPSEYQETYYVSRAKRQIPAILTTELEKTLLDFAAAELNSSTVAREEEEVTEWFQCLRPFVILFRWFGLCPFYICKSHLVAPPRVFNLLWLPVLIGLILELTSVGNHIVDLTYHPPVELSVESDPIINPDEGSGEGSGFVEDVGDKGSDDGHDHDTSQLVLIVNYSTHYFEIFCNAVFIIWKCREIPVFLSACKRIEIIWKKYPRGQNDKLIRDCWMLFALFVATNVLGVGVSYYNRVIRINATTRTVCGYFESFYSGYVPTSGGHCFVGIMFNAIEIYLEMRVNYAETLLALLSLILARYFVRFNQTFRSRVSGLPAARIHELCCDHKNLCKLVLLCNEVFSPLFAVVYILNLVNLFTRLYLFFQEDREDYEDQMYDWKLEIEGVYAFWYLIFIKTLVPSYLAARLHEEAHDGLTFLGSWSSCMQDPDPSTRLIMIRHFSSHFRVSRIGISGCRYFFINKRLILTLVGALATYAAIVWQF